VVAAVEVASAAGACVAGPGLAVGCEVDPVVAVVACVDGVDLAQVRVACPVAEADEAVVWAVVVVPHEVAEVPLRLLRVVPRPAEHMIAFF
jgi:hypothetical protein